MDVVGLYRDDPTYDGVAITAVIRRVRRAANPSLTTLDTTPRIQINLQIRYLGIQLGPQK
jgi:hypothetical protein